MEEETNDDVVLCLRAITYSSLAYGLIRNVLEVGSAENYLSEVEKIIESISRSGLKEFAKSSFYFYKARIEMMRGDNPFESLKKSEECLKKLEKTGITEAMRRFLKSLGGKPKEKFRRQLNEMYTLLYFDLGIVYLNADEMEEAGKCFENALDHAEAVQAKLGAKSRLGNIEVIERYNFEWKAGEEKISFKDLWNECESNLWELTNENIENICAEYLVSEIVKGEFKRENLEYMELHFDAFLLLNGIGCIFGFIDKNDALKELKELDLRGFPVDFRDPKKAAMLMEIRGHVEELYDSALDPTTRWKYEKIKKIEVIRGEPIWHMVFSSSQAFTRIMLFYIANDLE